MTNNLPTADFDETGFIGRNTLVTQLIGLCKGPYPVITIVGEGGIGKTSLALKVAYDVMDSSDKPFDAIVWTTAKTQQLTAGHIKEINNAIRSSLGMFEAISEQLGGETSDSVQEILTYLKEFKILLILDNLETVIDSRVSEFMANIPIGTKILITSRIGLGAYEFPVKLPSLSEIEAVQLIRTLARMRGVSILVEARNEKLAKYCRKMKNNPGYIKWFVSAIQSGQRPETVLDNPDIFLEFCMSNVYEYLNGHSKLVLKAMQAVPGRQSQAEIRYLTSNLDVIDLQRSLQQLLTTNMVNMSSTERGAAFETTYDISDLAREYLDRHHPLSQEELVDFSKRRRQLASTGERLVADRRGNPYSIKTINMRSKSDVVIAKHLYDVIKNSLDRRNSDESAKLIEEARRLAPDYYEVHRVEAFFLVNKGSYAAARNAYEAAIELEPNSAALHYWYGGFLMRYLDDTESAILEFEKAYKIDPNGYQIQLELARANLYLKRYPEAIQKITLLLNRQDIPESDKRKVYDLHLQYFARCAEYLVDFSRENIGALELLELMINAYNKMPKYLIDNKTIENIKKALPTARKCLYHIEDSGDYKERCNDVYEWLQSL